MAKKFEINNTGLRKPECIECFDVLIGHANGVFGSFEIAAADALAEFNLSATESLRETASRTDRTVQEHFKKQEIKEDEARDAHFEKQEAKYDNLEKKLWGLMTLAFKFFFAVIMICAAVVAATWITVQTKANTDEVVRINTFKDIMTISSSYNDQRFVIRPDQKFDKDNFQMIIETLLERNSRGITTEILIPPEQK